MKSACRIIYLFAGFVIFLASTLFVFVPQSAEASVPVHEWGTTGPIPTPMTMAWQPCKDLSLAAGLGCPGSGLTSFIPSWDGLAWIAAKVILHEFSQQIVQWIRTGQSPLFSGGTEGSLFVTNIDEFLLDAADNSAAVFLSEYYRDAYDFLCTPFRLNVGLGLGHSYGRDYGSFRYQARCSITDIVGNLEDFYNDFSNGGWEAWFQTARYANNPLGLLTLSLDVDIGREHRAVNANSSDFLAGLGFPGLRECPPENQIPGPTQNGQPLCKNNGYITKTPGKAIEDQVANLYGQEWRNLGIADEINEILFASFQSLLSWILSGGSDDGLLGANIRSVPPPRNRNCNTDTGRGFGCSCTVNTQCASNFCSPSTNTCSSPPRPPGNNPPQP